MKKKDRTYIRPVFKADEMPTAMSVQHRKETTIRTMPPPNPIRQAQFSCYVSVDMTSTVKCTVWEIEIDGEMAALSRTAAVSVPASGSANVILREQKNGGKTYLNAARSVPPSSL